MSSAAWLLEQALLADILRGQLVAAARREAGLWREEAAHRRERYGRHLGPWRLRDMRRAIGRLMAGSEGRELRAMRGLWGSLGIAPHTALWEALRGAGIRDPQLLSLGSLASRLDRLIAIHGPDAVVRVEAERTTHLTGSSDISGGPHTDADAATHGGDGNSGEIESPATTAADGREGSEPAPRWTGATDHAPDRTVDDDPCSDGLTGDGQAAEGARRLPASVPESAAGGGDRGAEEATEGVAARHDGRNGRADDDRAGHAVPAMGGGADGSRDTAQTSGRESGRSGSTDAGSRRPQRMHDIAARAAASRIARAIERLVDQAGARTDRSTPRYEPRALVRELVSRRVALHRAHEPQQRPQHVLVLADISESCGWIAGQTLPIAREVARRANLLVAETYTGNIARMHGTSALARALAGVWLDGTADDWRRLRRLGVSHLLVYGDGHGARSYLAAAQVGVRVCWVDPNPGITFRYTVIDGNPFSRALDAEQYGRLCRWMRDRGIRYASLDGHDERAIMRATESVL